MKNPLYFLAIHLSLNLIFFSSFSQGDDPIEFRVTKIGSSTTINCTSGPVTIGAIVTPEHNGYIYSWSSGQVAHSISVEPTVTTTYTLDISNPELNFHAVRFFTITVDNEPVALSDKEITIPKSICPGSEIVLNTEPSGGYPPYSYEWSNGDRAQSTKVYPSLSHQYQVTVTDVCGSEAISDVNVSLEPHDPIVAPESKFITFSCHAQEVETSPIVGTAYGGVGYGYRFSFEDWPAFSGTHKSIIAENDKEVKVNITDACELQYVQTKIIFIKEDPVIPMIDPEAVCKGELIDIVKSPNGERLYYWDGTTMNLSYESEIEISETYSLSYIDQCGDNHNVLRQIEVLSPDAEFDYDVHASINQVDLISKEFDASHAYEWYANGVFLGSGASLSTQMQSGAINDVELVVMDSHACTSKSNKTIHVRDNVSIPSAFSPNGDGHNDEFSMAFDEEYATFDIKIFDRWGQLVFESRDQYFRWEGDKSIQGKLNTFVYRISARTKSNEMIEKTGTLSIIN